MEIKLHALQKELLRKLTYNKELRFNDLLIEGLESEHMNYHLKKLIELGFVSKKDVNYLLTDKGKDYSNLMDDENTEIEKQPKTSIILTIVRKNAEGMIENLHYKRLKQPYLGKVGSLTGKVRFGESLEEAARRELFEESGLMIEKLTLELVYHKVRFRESGECVQDIIMYQFFGVEPTGNFIAKTKFQENYWISQADVKSNKYDFYDDYKFTERYEPHELRFVESIGVADGF